MSTMIELQVLADRESPDPRNRGARVPERKSVGINTYFQSLKQDFDINRIYYPGCGSDTTLEQAFSTDEIFYMDADDSGLSMEGRHFVYAHHDAIPFLNGYFDAIFYRDCHANDQQFLEMLRVLRVGGIVIRNEDICVNEIGHEEMAAIPGLVEVSRYHLLTEIDDTPMHVLQKVQKTPNPEKSPRRHKTLYRYIGP